MSPTTPQLEILHAQHYADYLVGYPREIAQILGGLIEKRALVTLYLGAGGHALVTTLLEVDESTGTLVFDVGPEAALNQRARQTPELICDAVLDKVKVQFLLSTPSEVDWAGRPAFRAALPTQVLRLQRRNDYRLAVPGAHAITCRFPWPASGPHRNRLEARVLDISGGGLALLLPASVPALGVGDEIPDCQLRLHDAGTIACRLHVRNRLKLPQRNGGELSRLGCEFVELSSAAANAIQRYILKVERERIARDRGL